MFGGSRPKKSHIPPDTPASPVRAPEPGEARRIAYQKSQIGSGPLHYLRRLGPGLVTGAANDDPGAIGTHAQVGAQFGAASFWLAPYTIPLTAVVLQMCAQIGNVSGRGLVTILRFHYPKWVLWGAVSLFTVANLINLAADIGVMGQAVRSLIPGPERMWLVVVAAVSGALPLLVPYETYARVLKGLALSLLGYVVAAFLVRQDWDAVLLSTFIPKFHWDYAFVMATVAVLGTRLSPYVLVWQPAQIVEEEIEAGEVRLADRLGSTEDEVRSLQVDVLAGSIAANLVTWAILVTSAATLHARGVTNVTSATQAAEALRPAAGNFAFALFALGILATGLLAVPVLSGGVAYAFGDALGWKRGLARETRKAPRFYATIVLCIAIAVLLNLIGANPIRALVLSQIVNGMVAIPLVFLVLRICNDPRVMGDRTNGLFGNVLGWGAFVVLLGVGVAVVWTTLTG